MTTPEKVAYLKGLAEGYGMDPATREGKLLATVLDILTDLAVDVDDLGSEVMELSEGLDAVSDDLEDVEDLLFGEDDPCSGCSDCDDLFYEATCPDCGEVVSFDEAILDSGSIECPGCGATLEFDEDEDEPAPEE